MILVISNIISSMGVKGATIRSISVLAACFKPPCPTCTLSITLNYHRMVPYPSSLWKTCQQISNHPHHLAFDQAALEPENRTIGHQHLLISMEGIHPLQMLLSLDALHLHSAAHGRTRLRRSDTYRCDVQFGSRTPGLERQIVYAHYSRYIGSGSLCARSRRVRLHVFSDRVRVLSLEGGG